MHNLLDRAGELQSALDERVSLIEHVPEQRLISAAAAQLQINLPPMPAD